jgi:predicted naringenin-chalcone synthase
MSYLLDIQTAVPLHKHPQDTILEYMQQAYSLDAADARKLSFLYRQSGIKTRYSVLDVFTQPIENQNFRFKENLIQDRMAVYETEALNLSGAAIAPILERQKTTPTHLITVSCTGMQAPGLDIQLCERFGFLPSIQRTSVNFMGCYAAIHALKMAHWITTSDDNASVLIVCTELCTLHFQNEFNTDTALSDLLFADGSAAILIGGQNHKPKYKALKFSSFYSELRLTAQTDMTWKIANSGFKMTLTGYVPQLIETDFKGFLSTAIQKANLEVSDITDWCIHPGGKKILEAIQKSLSIPKSELAHSYQILNDYGNMSSPTILFVLKQMLDNQNNDPINVFGAAFGPGLTLESFILQSV